MFAERMLVEQVLGAEHVVAETQMDGDQMMAEQVDRERMMAD